MIIDKIQNLIAEANGSMIVSESEIGGKLSALYNDTAKWFTGTSDAPAIIKPRSNFSAGRSVDDAVNSTVDSVNDSIDSVIDLATSTSNKIVNAYNSTLNYFTGVKTSVEETMDVVGKAGDFEGEVNKREIISYVTNVYNESKRLLKIAADATADTAQDAADKVQGAAAQVKNIVVDEIQARVQHTINMKMMNDLVDNAGDYKEYVYKFYSAFGKSPVIEKLMDLSNGDYKLFLGLVIGSGVALIGGFAGGTYLAVKKMTTKKEIEGALNTAANELKSASTPQAEAKARAKVVAIGSKAIALSKLKKAA
jgi:hypothetical protein